MAVRQTLVYDDVPFGVKMLTAGTSGCIADFLTFPLDTAKVRLQIQGEGRAVLETALASNSGAAFRTGAELQYNGLFGTIITIAKKEGPKALYNGLSAGLQRQMVFASVRLGFYDSVKALYQPIFDGKNRSGVSTGVGTKVAAGLTTGAMAVFVGQPTDVVKIRFQAETNPVKRYKSTFQAYSHIASKEGFRGLWRGILPNVARNSIINVAEIVCYDVVKEAILVRQLLDDNIPCHFVSAVVAGLSATVVASPVDVVKTRYMNASPGTYRGAFDCAIRTGLQEGPKAFYKGFLPSFTRLVSWNIFMWIIYEQMKKAVVEVAQKRSKNV